MTLRRLLATLLIALTVRASAVSLREELGNALSFFQNLSDAVSHLTDVVDVSQQLINDRQPASIKGELSSLLCPSKSVGNSMSLTTATEKAFQSLFLLEGLVDSDPILVLLSRRLVLACIVLKWLAEGHEPFDTHTERYLSEVARKFYTWHVASVAHKGILEYLHISKSGGTTFSHVAKSVDCEMGSGIGQLEALGDLPRWINGTAFEEVTGGATVMWSYYEEQVGRRDAAKGCEERADHARRRGYRYVSNEYTLHGGAAGMGKTHVCPQFVNVVTLRDPGERLVSHMHYMLARIKARLRHHMGDDDDGDASFRQLFCTNNATVWDSVAPTVMDNYNTRTFLGESVYHSPVGSLGDEHVAVAVRLLLQFDLVLDLAAGDGVSQRMFWQGLGWSVSESEMHARSKDLVFQKLNYSDEECQNEELVSALMLRQGPDRQLYKFGRTLSFLDLLLLDVARGLGLRPVAPGSDGSGRVAAGTAPDYGPCGLVGSNKGRPSRPRRLRAAL